MLNSHAHIDFVGVEKLESTNSCIVPSIGKNNWHAVTKFAYYALGIHPWYLEEHTTDDLKMLDQYINNNNPIAIGECGLDFNLNINKKKQKIYFQEHLSLAQKYQLPVVIHSVNATEEVIMTLKQFPSISGEIHGFSGSASQAELLTNMGFFLGFGMQITNINSTKLRSIVANTPLEFILIETDDHHNPNDILKVAYVVAELKQIPVDKIIEQCDNNALSLFNIKTKT